jgi:hypothetical protein
MYIKTMFGIVLVLIIGAMCSCVSQVEQQQALSDTLSSTLLCYFATVAAGFQCEACTCIGLSCAQHIRQWW